MQGVRILLSQISPVIHALLFGSFAESDLDSCIEYPTIAPPVFRCIIRASFHLDPNINELLVLHLFSAARMLQIDGLIAECKHFLAS